MIRPFRIRDVLWIRGLEPATVRLDQPEAATKSRSPLWLAFLDYPFQTGMGAHTFVKEDLGNGAPRGFVQARGRSGRPEWEIISLAPSREANNQAPLAWEQLLNYVGYAAAESGAVRIFARAKEDGAEQGALAKAGFGSYARQIVWQSQGIDGTEAASDLVRRRGAGDDWALHQLYLRATPPEVQMAEGQLNLGPMGRFDWGLAPGYREYVWQGQERLTAYLAVINGGGGHVLRVLSDPDDPDAGRRLLAWATSRAAAESKVIYCLTRHYDQHVAPWLTDNRFVKLGSQALMVKHLAVRIKEPVLRLEPALEPRVNRVATRTCDEYEPGSA